ncbi:MAG: hypothetical protein IJ465_05310 [Clostridia bacterium]|nr:hypothetical protein [Clostridia bacterium]
MKEILRRWAILLLVLVVLAVIAAESWLIPLVEAVGTHRSQALYDGTVNGMTADILQQYGWTDEDLLTVQTDAAGNVTAVYPDTVKLNRLAAELNESLMSQLRSETGMAFSVPSGSVFGGVWTANRGPLLTFRLTADSIVTTGIKDTVTSVGINQTCYTLSITVEQDVLLIYAGRYKTLTMRSEVMVVQTVLMGDVPQTYVDRWES